MLSSKDNNDLWIESRVMMMYIEFSFVLSPIRFIFYLVSPEEMYIVAVLCVS